MSLSLHDVLQNSYKGRDKQQNAFRENGYIYDDELSNHNQQAYYNPTSNKLLFSVAGSHNLSDAVTDAYLGAGKLKYTHRYKEADETFNKAKVKYNPTETVVAGHSLGSPIARYIAKPNDKVYTYNGGATIGQSNHENERAYRTNADVVSLFYKNANNINTQYKPYMGNGVLRAYDAHKIDHLKNKDITI